MRIGGEAVTYGDHVLVVGDAAGKQNWSEMQLVYVVGDQRAMNLFFFYRFYRPYDGGGHPPLDGGW